MTRLPIIVAAAIFSVLFCLPVRAQQTNSAIEIRSLNGGNANVTYDMRTRTASGTNGIFIDYNGSILTADAVSVDEISGAATADGNVHVQQGDQIWVGKHINYNFKTHEMTAEQFRSGKAPVFMDGHKAFGLFNADGTKIETLETEDMAAISAHRRNLLPVVVH